ncbi:MAG: FAD-dependent oxidoreductase, partial [Proteobacteria bacterium]|nr:FAD-dependent oxidoreductase [Pseudomonadota bacterium]
ALPNELAELQKQGIKIQNCWGPQSFTSANKLSLTSCTSVFDSQGKFCPSFDKSRTSEIEFDQVIMAVGQSVEPALASYLQKELGRSDLILVDETTQEVKDHPGIYAGGDIVRGAGTVVQAVADGRRAAMAIHANLKKQI